MITNPTIMESGSQPLERRVGWLRSGNSSSNRVGKGESNASRAETETGSGAGFDEVDQISKGLVGRIATPEWQGKIDLAQGVQIADRSMQAIDEKLQQAKDDLTRIHKMFPPYPHGSEEREALLNSYKSLRMQIDQLTFPPESDTAAQILGGERDSEKKSEVGQFPVHPGTGGLDLAELKTPVSELEDSELPALVEDLERASGVLNERRQGLEKSADKILKQKSGDEVVFAKLSSEIQGKLALLDNPMGRPKTGVHQDLPFL